MKITRAMKKLADELGWAVESSGRSWTVTRLNGRTRNPFRGLSMTNKTLFMHMATVAMSPQEAGGLGLDGPELAARIGMDVRYVKDGRYDRYLPHFGRVGASEEAMLRRMFPIRTGEELKEWRESLSG